MNERLRELERALRLDPSDARAAASLEAEKRRRGLVPELPLGATLLAVAVSGPHHAPPNRGRIPGGPDALVPPWGASLYD